jgi:hypothetical protein
MLGDAILTRRRGGAEEDAEKRQIKKEGIRDVYACAKRAEKAEEEASELCSDWQAEACPTTADQVGHASSRKLRTIFRPTAPDFSGWNWTP